jgi:hypothetical protein
MVDKMELKELVLSSIKEIEEDSKTLCNNSSYKEDDNFLYLIKERIRVLSMGLKSPNIKNSKDKLDITLKFLDSLSSEIERRTKK